MTNKDIQQLIDRYLEGETSPEEEKVLARELLREDSFPARGEVSVGRRGGSSEWQAIRLMLGELAMGEAEYDTIMEKRQQTANQKARIVSMKWRWVAAAASLLLLIGMGTMLFMKEKDMMPPVQMSSEESPEGVPVVADLKSVVEDLKPATQQPVVADLKSATQQTGDFKSPSTESSPSATPSVESSPSAEDPNLHYAALETTTDTVAYQDPARVDEFIEKLASVHALPIQLTCSATLDSTVTSAVYVFPDKANRPTVGTGCQEVDVFARLLQVACCYSDETPGYLLNFSHLQFFFQLKDMRRHLQHLWIAERVNGKILLYSTCSPIDAIVSSACYQEYRDELMHTKSIQTKTLDI